MENNDSAPTAKECLRFALVNLSITGVGGILGLVANSSAHGLFLGLMGGMAIVGLLSTFPPLMVGLFGDDNVG